MCTKEPFSSLEFHISKVVFNKMPAYKRPVALSPASFPGDVRGLCYSTSISLAESLSGLFAPCFVFFLFFTPSIEKVTKIPAKYSTT